MTTIRRRRADLCGLARLALLTAVAATSDVARAQALDAADAPGHLLGRVCIDEDADGVCGKREPGLPGARVFTDDGLIAYTDELGRYHLADLGRRSLAVTPSGSPFVRLRHVAVRTDVGALGPAAKAPAAVVVPVFPGAVARVDLPVQPPRWREAPPLLLARDAGDALRLAGRGEVVVARVPARVEAGHRVQVEGTDVDVAEDGTFLLDVPLGARSGVVRVVERAPDGRHRVTRVRVARVPRATGGDLLLVDEVRWLASLDLPPPGLAVAPGALRVPVRAQPGVDVRWVGSRTQRSRGALLVDISAGDHDVRAIEVTVAGDDATALTFASGVVVDPLAGARWLAFGDVRAGVPVAPFALDGFAVEGRLSSSFELPLAGVPVLDLVGGRVEGVVDVGDEWMADALAGQLRYGARGTAGFARFLEDDDLPFFADESVTTAQNPAALPFTARWVGEAGAVGVGAGRTSLDGAEIGRFDRAITGPHVDVEKAFGPVALSARGGADVAVVPFVDGSYARARHAELSGTGGTVYRLPQRDVVPGSERLWVEVSDPLTGLVKQRRALVRGRDYDVDYPSGLVLLASPVGREGSPAVGRLAAAGTAFESRVVADYLVSSFGPVDGGSYGGRLGARVLGIEVGVRAAGDSSTGYLLGGVDVEASPLPWLTVNASAADSMGDPFVEPDAFLLSRDGGASWRSPSSPGARPTGGLAYAARARVGDEDDGVLLWGALREPGYRDGAFKSDEGALQVGGEGHLRLGGSRFGLFADWREGPVPKGALDDALRAEVRTGAVRVEQPLGRLFTAAVEGHARQVALERALVRENGGTAAAGVELVWHAHPKLDLLASHLQSLYSTGVGPGARELTFSSLGGRFHDDDGSLEARAGLRPDGSVAGNARWDRAHDDGGTSYGGFDLSPDDVFAPRGLSSVSGARQAATPDTAVFVESRLTDDPLFGLSTGQAVGGEVGAGPLRLVASWERSRRFLDVSDSWEGVHAQLGLAERYLSAQGFGEVRRDVDGGDVVQWYAGSSARVDLLRDVSLGGRVLVGQPGPDERPLALGRVGLAVRAPSWPVVLGSYNVRQDLPGAFEGDAPRLRQHIGLASVGVYPWPLLSLLVSTRGRVTEVLDEEGAATLATQAGVVAVRTGVLLFDVFEPAVEVAARAVTGAELPLETDLSARMEGVFVLGPVRVGGGFVVAGFTGTGLEEPTLDPPARLYAVLQGAL